MRKELERMQKQSLDTQTTLLEAELTRVIAEHPATLGRSPKELSVTIVNWVVELIAENERTAFFLSSTFVNEVANYLVASQILTESQIDYERYFILLIISVAITKIAKTRKN